jgi:CDP-diacylglycerol--serine O-phosphatidyltransferase
MAAAEPDQDPARRARPGRESGGRRVSALIPNLLTVAALCAGLTAVRFAILGQWQPAVAAILVAAVLDGLDGRMARLLNATSKFGAELDSLADFVSFGAAPALILYLWSGQMAGGIGWIASLFFAVCCALRLARFNTMLTDPSPPAWAPYYFTGVPAPAGACLALMPLMLSFEWPNGPFALPHVVVPTLLLIGALMVSRVPTFAAKQMRIPRSLTLPALILAALAVGAAVAAPWASFIVAGALYVASIPVSVILQRRAAMAAQRQG